MELERRKEEGEKGLIKQGGGSNTGLEEYDARTVRHPGVQSHTAGTTACTRSHTISHRSFVTFYIHPRNPNGSHAHGL